MLWDNVYVALPIETDIDTKISAQIKSMMENDNRPYYAAAMYYMETGKDLNQAVAWLEKASQQNPTAFWIFYQKARALSMQGKKPMPSPLPTNQSNSPKQLRTTTM